MLTAISRGFEAEAFMGCHHPSHSIKALQMLIKDTSSSSAVQRSSSWQH